MPAKTSSTGTSDRKKLPIRTSNHKRIDVIRAQILAIHLEQAKVLYPSNSDLKLTIESTELQGREMEYLAWVVDRNGGDGRNLGGYGENEEEACLIVLDLVKYVINKEGKEKA